MKKTNFATIPVAITTLLFLSCSKDPENPTCTTSSATIAGSYKVTAATYKASPSAPEIDYINVLNDACERDDIITFNSNGTYQYTDAGIVCSPSGNDIGTWSLTGTTSITIDGDAAILESFDCKTLILANTDTQVAGDRIKITLTKQ